MFKKANFKKNIACLSLLFFAVFAFCSCSSDEEITDADANTELVKEATNYLNGEIVLSTNATMNGVNKTLYQRDAQQSSSLSGVRPTHKHSPFLCLTSRSETWE